MTNDEKAEVSSCVDQEGFDYAFVHYSRFDEIKDAKFHKLRKAYVAAQFALAEYIKTEET